MAVELRASHSLVRMPIAAGHPQSDWRQVAARIMLQRTSSDAARPPPPLPPPLLLTPTCTSSPCPPSTLLYPHNLTLGDLLCRLSAAWPPSPDPCKPTLPTLPPMQRRQPCGHFDEPPHERHSVQHRTCPGENQVSQSAAAARPCAGQREPLSPLPHASAPADPACRRF